MAAAQTAAEGLTVASVGAALAAAGIDPFLLLYSLWGAGLFVLLSGAMGRWRTLACAGFALPIGPVVGHAAAVRWFASDPDWMRGVAFLATPVVVLLVRGLIATLEARSAGLWGTMADRIGGEK